VALRLVSEATLVLVLVGLWSWAAVEVLELVESVALSAAVLLDD
jgi:hypothetical protein